jgi:hypothetical protein
MKLGNRFRAFLDGAASVLDLMGTLYSSRMDEILSRSDSDALRSDWEAVGKDFLILEKPEEKQSKK